MSAWQLDERHEDAMLLAAASPGHRVFPGDLSEALHWDHDECLEVMSEIVAAGFGETDRSAAAELTLSGRGRREAQRGQQSRKSGSSRTESVQRALLTWLAAFDRYEPVTRFLSDPSAVAFGVPFAEDEVCQAVAFLAAHNLVTTRHTFSDPHAAAYISAEGRAALNSAEPISEYTRATPRTYHYDHSTTSISSGDYSPIQYGGGNNTQTVAHVVQWPERQQFITAVDRLSELAAGDAIDLRPRLELLKARAQEPSPNVSSLKGLILDIVGNAAGTVGGQALLVGLAALAPLLPYVG